MSKKNEGKRKENTAQTNKSSSSELSKFLEQQLKEHAVAELFFTQEKDGSLIAYTQQADAERRQYYLNRLYNFNHSVLRASKS